MTQEHWRLLLSVLDGAACDPLPVGFIADSPWLPRWAGMSIMDYYASETRWLDANVRMVRRFPEVMFLPGFWAEYGMCTEPSAFGARCTWSEDEFPFAHKVLADHDAAATLEKPDPARDGLPPFVLKRLEHCRPAIEDAGHVIRFAVARGPWNVASFLLGTTEFMMGLRQDADKSHALLETVTTFLVDWLQLQARTIPTIDGILILDDIVGFVGKKDLVEFGTPYFKRIFSAIDARVRFFHNDAAGRVCAPLLADWGVNLFNFSFEHSLAEMQQFTQGRVTLLGNIPPRDVMAAGTPEDVQRSVVESLAGLESTSRIIVSCGGGLPPGVPTENIEAVVAACRTCRRPQLEPR